MQIWSNGEDSDASTDGVPVIFHCQLNVISQHIASIKLDNEARNERHKRYLDAILPQVYALKSK